MGKQRSKVLSRQARELYKLYSDKFSNDYEKNKKALDGFGIFPNKLERNIVAGYIVKLVQAQSIT